MSCYLTVKLNQVIVNEEEGSNDSLTYQQLQIMLLEQFGEDSFSYVISGHQYGYTCTSEIILI